MFYLEEGNDKQWQRVRDQYPWVFREELDTLKEVKTHIKAPEDTILSFFKTRLLA